MHTGPRHHTHPERDAKKSVHLLSKIHLNTETCVMLLSSQLLATAPSYSKCPQTQARKIIWEELSGPFLPLYLKTGYVTFNNLGSKHLKYVTMQVESFFF